MHLHLCSSITKLEPITYKFPLEDNCVHKYFYSEDFNDEEDPIKLSLVKRGSGGRFRHEGSRVLDFDHLNEGGI
jgi:hypothetical protein